MNSQMTILSVASDAVREDIETLFPELKDQEKIYELIDSIAGLIEAMIEAEIERHLENKHDTERR